MIDTIKLYLDVADCGGVDLLPTATSLINGKEITNRATGEVRISGNVGKWYVNVGTGNIYMSGTLADILFENNSRILTRHEVKDAIDKLSDLLHLPIGCARVQRLDCAYHWIMNYPIWYYFPLLDDLPHYYRIQVSRNTLRYDKGINPNRIENILQFYNKSRECRDKQKTMHNIYDNVNVLRYECKWLRNVAKQIGVNNISASTLSERDFYRTMIKRWAERYNAIMKHHTPYPVVPQFKDKRAAKQYVFGYLVNMADANVLNELKQQIKDSHSLDSRYFTDLWRDIRKSAEAILVDIKHDLISELNDNVANVLAYCK